MPSTEGFEQYVRFLKGRHQDAKTALDQLKSALISENADQKLRLATASRKALSDLQASLGASDRPQWLAGLISNLAQYEQNAGHPQITRSLLDAIVQTDAAISTQFWSDAQQKDSGPAVDFSAISADAVRASKLDEHFDTLIQQIEAVIATEQVDSIRIRRELERLAATLRKSRSGDLYARVAAWRLARGYVANLSRHLLETVPVLSHLVKPLHKTLDDMDHEMDVVRDEIDHKLQAVIDSAGFDVLDFIPMNRPPALPSPPTVSGPNGVT